MKNVFLLAVVLLTFSCSESEEIPEGILSQDKMVSILIDIRIAEGKVGSLSVSKDSARTLFQELQRRAFEKHDLDSAIYRKSYQYYILNPQRYLEVNDIVLDSLKVMQQQLDTK